MERIIRGEHKSKERGKMNSPISDRNRDGDREGQTAPRVLPMAATERVSVSSDDGREEERRGEEDIGKERRGHRPPRKVRCTICCRFVNPAHRPTFDYKLG